MNASQLIDKQIADVPGWQGGMMAKLRKLIHTADPEIVEEWKWDTGVYTHNKLVCAVSHFKDHVKINFFKGVHLKDEHHLLNAGLESKQNRAINFAQTDIIREKELVDLIQEAVVKKTNK
jgi:hypothetical protein